MITPPKKELFTGTVANDGTGDTLRDAAVKINDNFTQLWDDVYNDEVVAPGRKFVCQSISADAADSGSFTLSALIEDDSDQIFKIHAKDQDKKEFKTGSSAQFATKLSIWELDSGTLDDWTFMEYQDGYVNYQNNNWTFTKNTVLFSNGTIEADRTYYLELQGVW